ncbi:translocation protein TolB [Symmachiella dynata]|uniref:WD40 repeat domain-containing protein n=1 Tax=Symmachiella dynata TaxID=2527995 RepID=UPI00118AE094|nr:WD40 repeat domain-containing protein [Symmachiella dynata]QDT47689.1 translocation protein TolB [Symmachiella dynata]
MTHASRSLALVLALSLNIGSDLPLTAAEGIETQHHRTDALGDPLPEAALLRMGTVRFRHPSSIVDMALSPDDKAVVTFEDDIIVWDAATGKERWRSNTRQFGYSLPHASYGVRAIAFARDGQTFYTPGRPDDIIAWNVSSGGHTVITLQPGFPVPRDHLGRGNARSIDIAPDNQKFAVGNQSGLSVCDKTGKVLYQITNNPENPINDINNDRLRFGGDFSYGRFSPDGKLLAVVNSESPQQIRLHEAQSGKELRRIPLTNNLVRFDFSPDSKQIVATERDSAVRLYEVATSNKVWDYKIELKNNAESYTCAVAFSPDAKTIAVCAPIGSDEDIHLLHAADGKRFGKPLVHQSKPWAVAFTADSTTLFSSGWDGRIRRWDVATQKQLTLPGALRATGASAASPDGKSVAFCDDTGTVHLHNVADGSEVRQLKMPGTSYSELAFSPDGRQLAGGGLANEQTHVAVWDLSDGRLLHRWEWPKGRDTHSNITELSFSRDGQHVAAVVFRQSRGYIWDLTTGKQIATLPHRQIHGLSYSTDNRTLATTGWDRVVRFWNTETGEKLREFDVSSINPPNNQWGVSMHAVRYSPQNDLVATMHTGGQVRFWDVDSLKLVSKFKNPDSFFTQGGTGFSPDGLWYATGDKSGRLRLWDPLTGQIVWDRGRHPDSTKARGFGGHGETLISSGDGVCYLWDLEPADLPLDKTLDQLWDDLAGQDSPAAYRAIWAMSKQPQATVELLGKKLRAVEEVVDMSRVGLDLSDEEANRRKRLKRLMVAKKPGMETLPTVQRAISLLVQIGTPEAVALIEKLTIANNEAVNQSAKHALSRIEKR